MLRNGAIEQHLAAIDKEIASASPENLPALLAALSARVSSASTRLLTVRPDGPAPSPATDANLSVDEAAERLGVSRDYVYRHASEFPFTVRIGRRLLFSARKLEAWNREQGGKRA